MWAFFDHHWWAFLVVAGLIFLAITAVDSMWGNYCRVRIVEAEKKK